MKRSRKGDIELMGYTLGELPWEALGRQGPAWGHLHIRLGEVPKEEFLGRA